MTIEHVEHFTLCPCGACQTIRAARPEPPVPLCYWPCCGATMKLIRTLEGFAGKETHLDSCPDTGAFLMPKTKEN